MSDRELIISSGIVVRPGDKVVLTLPDYVTPSELQYVKDRLEQWAPGVDWLLVAGVQAVIHKPAEQPFSAPAVSEEER